MACVKFKNPFLRRNGLTEKDVYFHLSDEPGEDHLEQYRKCSALVRPLLPGFTILDAVSHVSFFDEGLIGCPVVNESRIEDFLDRTGISHEALDKYCRAVEKTTPESEYEFTKLVMSLNMEDFDIHNFKNSKTFYQLMKCKNESYIDESDPARYNSVDGVGFRGYLNTIETPDGYTAHVFLYPEREKRTRYIIKISTENFGDIFTIADSIKLT